ncbi:MAG: DNA polymerase/3'-5' exonuclease PolX [Actinobacteria bacterium]|nr:DNA polymerase/3'-5' exonuclease PolX [Actinomycetota bacterium]
MAKALPRNADVADQLDLLADLSELLGEEGFRVLAYRRAATRVRETPASIAELALAGEAKGLPGIGKTIEGKIAEIVETGEIAALTRRKELVPQEVVAFLRLPGIGPKTAARIWRELGVTTLVELREAAQSERLQTLAGLGARSEEKILKALAAGLGAEEEKRGLLGTGLPAVLGVVADLRAHPAAVEVSEAGSVRRRKETFRDLDVIATATDPAALTEAFTRLPLVAEIVAHGDTKATVISHDGLRFDLRVVPPECFGNLLQHFTGSKEHNVAMREEAQRRGLSISEYGVTTVETGEVVTASTEEELYAYLGYAFIPPELRENAGELEAARAAALPVLVEPGDLRGDLHTHSTWSDGRATIAEMAAAARARGYAYLAVCDHSQRLREGRLQAQWEEIDALNERLKPFRLLKGVEVNIRADGSLDLPDGALAALDWVMASVHSSFDRDPTGRVLAAMESLHVDCIGHLTGRKIGKRLPADVDLERVVEKALETGTFLELNSQPDRLDLRDVHARLAAEAGVPLVVSSDGHRPHELAFVELGIAQARRAWLTKAQVVNTRPWPEIERMRK